MGKQMLKREPPLLPCLIEVKLVTQAIQFMIWGMMDALEERILQMSAPSKMSFRFMQSSQLLSEWSDALLHPC